MWARHLGTIGHHLADCFVDLSPQRPHLRRVVRLLIGESLRDDHAAVGVDGQMQLAPGAA